MREERGGWGSGFKFKGSRRSRRVGIWRSVGIPQYKGGVERAREVTGQPRNEYRDEVVQSQVQVRSGVIVCSGVAVVWQ